MIKHVPQIAPFVQHLDVGKLPHFAGCFNLSDKSPHLSNTWMLVKQPILWDDFTCPTNHPVCPIFRGWQISPFVGRFQLSLFSAKLAYTFTSDISHYNQVFDDFTKFTHSTQNQVSPHNPCFATTCVFTIHAFLVNSPIYRMFQLVPQTTQINQHLNVGKSGCFHWCFQTSHKRPHLTNTWMLVN